MAKPRRQWFVTFYSPGTLFAESTTLPIEQPDTRMSAHMALGIKERYGALPFGWRFKECFVAEPIDDGEGGKLEVLPKSVDGTESGMYHWTGRVETLDDVEARNDPTERILRENMICNGTVLVVVNDNSYRSTHPFETRDVIVNRAGDVVERGNDRKWVEYRERTMERLAQERARR